MAKKIVVKKQFEKAYRQLSSSDRRFTDDALKHLEDYLKTGRAPVGFGLKHLGSGIYEFRISLALRAVYIADQDRVFLSLLGAHDDVRRFLKRR